MYKFLSYLNGSLLFFFWVIQYGMPSVVLNVNRFLRELKLFFILFCYHFHWTKCTRGFFLMLHIIKGTKLGGKLLNLNVSLRQYITMYANEIYKNGKILTVEKMKSGTS